MLSKSVNIFFRYAHRHTDCYENITSSAEVIKRITDCDDVTAVCQIICRVYEKQTTLQRETTAVSVYCKHQLGYSASQSKMYRYDTLHCAILLTPAQGTSRDVCSQWQLSTCTTAIGVVRDAALNRNFQRLHVSVVSRTLFTNTPSLPDYRSSAVSQSVSQYIGQLGRLSLSEQVKSSCFIHSR